MLLLSFPCCVFLGSYCTSFERKLSLPFFFLFRLLFRRCPPRFPRARAARAHHPSTRRSPHAPRARAAVPHFISTNQLASRTARTRGGAAFYFHQPGRPATVPAFHRHFCPSLVRPGPHRTRPSTPRIVPGSSHRHRPQHRRRGPTPRCVLFSVRCPCARAIFVGRSLHQSALIFFCPPASIRRLECRRPRCRASIRCVICRRRCVICRRCCFSFFYQS